MSSKTMANKSNPLLGFVLIAVIFAVLTALTYALVSGWLLSALMAIVSSAWGVSILVGLVLTIAMVGALYQWDKRAK